MTPTNNMWERFEAIIKLVVMLTVLFSPILGAFAVYKDYSSGNLILFLILLTVWSYVWDKID